MGGAKGESSTRPGKLKTIESVSEMLKENDFIFSIPSSRINGVDIVKLRKGLPDGCIARVVKNKLMIIASEGTAFESVKDLAKGENMWVFYKGDNPGTPINYILDFTKELDKKEELAIKNGIYEGQNLDADGVIAISKLPSKQELMQRLAVALNSVPTKLGRSIKIIPTKLGRAVKLAFADPDGDGAAAEGEAGDAATPAEEGKEGDAAEDAPAE
ncbi:unnamed protein product [Choristocarpus tenellus]